MACVCRICYGLVIHYSLVCQSVIQNLMHHLCCTLQLMSVLEEDEFARSYQLANKLQKVHLLMRVRV